MLLSCCWRKNRLKVLKENFAKVSRTRKFAEKALLFRTRACYNGKFSIINWWLRNHLAIYHQTHLHHHLYIHYLFFPTVIMLQVVSRAFTPIATRVVVGRLAVSALPAITAALRATNLNGVRYPYLTWGTFPFFFYKFISLYILYVYCCLCWFTTKLLAYMHFF